MSNLAFWAVVSVISVSESAFYYIIRDQAIPWKNFLIWDLNWPMWLLFSLPIIQFLYLLVQRKKSWTQLGWQIFGVSIVMSVLLVLFESGLNYAGKIWLTTEEPLFKDVFLLILTYKVHVNVIIIIALTGATIALNAFEESKIHENRSNKFEKRTEELNRQLTEAHLDALKRQLKPHFLFNSMHLISGLILKKEYDNAMKMIARLSDLLRHTLKYDQQHWITLDEEMELTRLYLEIHQVRFGAGLQTAIELDNLARSVRVPTYILQPIVENSLVHGLEPRKNNGLISIKCSVVEDELHITVSDNGKGINMDGKILEHIGIQNTRSRLHSLFGSNFVFKYSNGHDQGFMTKFVIPIFNDDFYEEAS